VQCFFFFRTHAADLNGANDGRVKHGNLYGNVNTGYQHDGQQATPMVTFNPNPAHTPGIAINDSRSTKVRSNFFLSEVLAWLLETYNALSRSQITFSQSFALLIERRVFIRDFLKAKKALFVFTLWTKNRVGLFDDKRTESQPK